MPYSKNSHKTPIVIEKQNATTATNKGDNLFNEFFLFFLFNISIIEKPIAAHKNPFKVCKIVSQCLNTP